MFQHLKNVVCAEYLVVHGLWPRLEEYIGERGDYAWPVEEGRDDETIAKTIEYRMGNLDVFGIDVETVRVGYPVSISLSCVLIVCPKEPGRAREELWYNGNPYFTSR